MRIDRAFALLLLVSSAAAVQAQSAIRWHVLKSGQRSKELRPRRSVYATPDKFGTYWERNFGTAKQPLIHWDTERVVAIHLGRRGSSGYTAVVTDVAQEGDHLVVYWHEALPAPRIKQMEVETSPYTLLAIPAGNEAVRFAASVKDPANEFATGDAFPKKTFLSGAHCFIEKEITKVIEDRNTLADVWLGAFGRGTQPPPADFDHVKLAAIFLGQRPTPGYVINLVRIARIGPHEVQVQYSETVPAKDVILPQMVTNPFVIVELPKTDDTISIERVP